MKYILRKGIEFCYIDESNAVHKVTDINKATQFPTENKANDIRKWANNKLAGFTVVEAPEDCEGKLLKTERVKISTGDRNRIYNKNKGRCAICGEFVPCNDFTIDHIIPLAKGGTNELDNLQCACRTCNVMKQDILPQDLMVKLRQIMLYQMENSFDKTFWKRLKEIRSRKRSNKWKRIMKIT